MMVQTKIFTSTSSSKLEQNMNEWLEDLCSYSVGDVIKHVIYLATPIGILTQYNAMVVYEA